MRARGRLGHAERVTAPTQRGVSPAYVRSAAATAFGGGATVTAAEPMAGGNFAEVWAVELSDGRRVVLKVGADPAAPVLSYEHDLLAAEAAYLRLVAEHRPDVPTPRVLCETPEWIFMTFQPGIALPADVDTTPARKECGAAFAGLHTITGDGSGTSATGPTGRPGRRRTGP